MEESQKLDEMARTIINSPNDNLPFKVAVNLPDHLPPHAHIFDMATKPKGIWQWLRNEL